MNTIGLIGAIVVFLGIWLGHVAVRNIEYLLPNLWLPFGLFLAGAGLLVWLSLKAASTPGSAVLGVLGLLFFWDAVELLRQQKRVKIGHAPANPSNPRHAQILQQYPAATTVDPLHALKSERD